MFGDAVVRGRAVVVTGLDHSRESGAIDPRDSLLAGLGLGAQLRNARGRPVPGPRRYDGGWSYERRSGGLVGAPSCLAAR